MTRLVRAYAVLIGALVAGCTSGTATTATVTGEVMFDGLPLKEGIIKFIPADGKTPTADARIADGKFNATVPLGEKRIEISAPKVVGKLKMYDTPESPVVDQVTELIPAKFNVSSTLTWKIDKGSQEKRFELTSK